MHEAMSAPWEVVESLKPCLNEMEQRKKWSKSCTNVPNCLMANWVMLLFDVDPNVAPAHFEPHTVPKMQEETVKKELQHFCGVRL
jgi:hypothetical protein